MIRFLKALILLPIAVLVVLLAVANRNAVTLSFDPFSQDAPEFSATVPLYAVLFACVAVGIIIGGVATWLAQGKHRKARRTIGREVRYLRTETERLRMQGGPGSTPSLPSSQMSQL